MKELLFVFRNLWILFVLSVLRYSMFFNVFVTYILVGLMPAKESSDSEEPVQEEEVHHIIRSLTAIMEEKKLYKDPKVNVEMICRELATNRTYLTNEINKMYHVGFRDFLNNYRIKKAEELLCDETYKHLPLVEISEQVGFKNYGTFNSTFKKHFGVTPHQWRSNRSKQTENII